MTTIRTATIRHLDRQPSIDTVRRYLPRGYQAIQQAPNSILIVGTDVAGWTLDGYIIPRFAFGLIRVVEGPSIEIPTITVSIENGGVSGVTANIDGIEVPVPATVLDHDRMLIDVVDGEIVDVPTTREVSA